MEDKGFSSGTGEYRDGGSACLGCQRGAGFALLGCPWLSQMAGNHPHRLSARSVPVQEGMGSCCPCGIYGKMCLQSLQMCTATASTVMVSCQVFNSSSCALLWLPAELDLSSPPVSPTVLLPLLPNRGRASHAALRVPGGAT